jgi:nicotinate-nucleotide adenylyltransferase
MKIAIFSGSFDPPHNGHFAVADYLCENEQFDEVWFTITPHNPLKEKQAISPTPVRIAMVEAVLANHPKFRVCDIECSLPQPSYTINTLMALQQRYPQHEFTLVIGADNWANLTQWKDYEKIVAQFNIMVYPRQGYAVHIPQDYRTVTFIQAPLVNISSTLVRQAAAQGNLQQYAQFLSAQTIAYITKNKLYENTATTSLSQPAHPH